MSRIAKTFAKLKAANQPALGPYVTIGFPTLDTTEKVVLALIEAGADLVELGVPFSDPIAEGPVIQSASFVALQNGVDRQICLDTARHLRSQTDTPLLFMGYYNPIYSYGMERYVAECAEAGIDGLIIPDLALEETADLQAICAKHGLDLILFVAPTSTEERIKKVAELATGCIYCIAATGVTGARASISDELPAFVAKVRRYTDVPILIGFGISKPEHFAEAARIADGAFVGSALIDTLAHAPASERVEAAAALVRHLKGGAVAEAVS